MANDTKFNNVKCVVLAFDLSVNSTGIALLSLNYLNEITVLNAECLDLHSYKNVGPKLGRMFQNFTNCIRYAKTYAKAYGCELQVVKERPFIHHTFKQGVERLYMAHGVLELAAYNAEVIMSELSPATVKKYVAGSGKASKLEVCRCIQPYLTPGGQEVDFTNDDITDAIAVAITHLIKGGYYCG